MSTAEGRTGRRAIHLGILLMIGSSLVGVGLDSIAKTLGQTLPVAEVVWARYAFSFLSLLPLVPRLGLAPLLTSRRPWLQLGRSTALVTSGVLYFWALRYIPLADATAIAFVSPLILTALSALALGERVGLGLWISIAVGLAGTLLITQPGSTSHGWEALLPLGSAALYALYQLLTRKIAPYDGVAVSLLYSTLVGAFAMSCFVPFVWVGPSAGEWLLIVALGSLGTLSQVCVIRAFALAPASVLAPFNYAAILWAVPFGWLLFGDLPDAWSIAGAGIIVLSGLYVLGIAHDDTGGKPAPGPVRSPQP
ncbi:MAG: DMT family transporter [Proteobacteria bacterium]|nr:DMT family transporter [Pseudomonadota bacterium]MBI3496969.1 DMT family transporter [Pseudomonadota bacterium]